MFYVSDKVLLELVQTYQIDPSSPKSESLAKCLKAIARQLVSYSKLKISIGKRELERQMVYQCFEKIGNYNPKKGKID